MREDILFIERNGKRYRLIAEEEITGCTKCALKSDGCPMFKNGELICGVGWDTDVIWVEDKDDKGVEK